MPTLTYTLRPYEPADMPRMVEIVNTQSYEPTTLEEALRTEAYRRPEDPFCRITAVDATGRPIGFATGAGGLGMMPGEFDLKIRVDAGCQRQGVGRALYRALEAWALGQGAKAFSCAVNEIHPEAVAWAERRGYVQKYHLFKSTLDLTTWDPSPFMGAVAAAEAQGIRFCSLAEAATTEADYRRLYDYIGVLMDDMPGALGRSRSPYDRWRHFTQTDPRWIPSEQFLAVDGDRWVASTALNRLPSGVLLNAFTGVAREYRGRGLALAIKVVALNYARGLGMPYIRTSNHSVNAPMLAVNRKLGYVPAPGSFTMKKQVES